jgi:hypothetical protein
MASAVVFLISSIFPVVAGFVNDTAAWPQWWGVVDVSVAFTLAVLAFAVLALGQNTVTKQVESASYNAYRVLIHAIIVGLAGFALLGDQIVWSNCVTGFAWRFWLLLYVLPAWLSCFDPSATNKL